MKLYYAPGACSLAPHIVVREAGIPIELQKVDLDTKMLADGRQYTKVNGKGYVPALVLDDGSLLTEVPVILQYLADHKPKAGLAPTTHGMERYHMGEWLNFISSELHKGFGNFFNPALTPEWRKGASERLALRLDWLAEQLKGRPCLVGERFTVADAYLFTILNWAPMVKFDLDAWQSLQDYHYRVGQRPKVQEALRAEALLKEA